MNKAIEQQPPALITHQSKMMRTMMQMPLWMYRLGWGRVIRNLPFMVLTTCGRTSHKPRHTVLEYRRHGSKLYVFSMWGTRADWYKNILNDPHVTVRRGSEARTAVASVVDDPAEAMRALYMFRHHSPIYNQVMAWMSSADTINMNTLTDVADEFTVVRFELTDDPIHLPTIAADRAWVGQAIVALTALLIIVRLARSWIQSD